MKIIALIFYLLNLSSICFGSSSLCSKSHYNAQDHYKNFEELKIFEKEGIDFKIIERDSNYPVTIIAPHAGRIELGTSEIAHAIAGSGWNLYLFEGIKSKGNFILHITSSNFNEPRAMELLIKSELGVSIHGFKEEQLELIEIGGANLKVGSAVAKALTSLGFEVHFPSQRFQGNGPDNIVNRAKNAGMQLELSSKLRAKLLQNHNRLGEFGRTIRRVVEDAILSD